MARTPDDRFREQLDALVGGGVPEDVRAAHRRDIEARAAALGPADLSTAAGSSLPFRARLQARRWTAALGGVGALLVPGAAVASQGAVPGDTLYSVKQATERVVSLADSRIPATNRLEELETLLERDEPDVDAVLAALDDAEVAVAAIDSPSDLVTWLDSLRAEVDELLAELAAEAESQAPTEIAPEVVEPEPVPAVTDEDDDTDEDDETDADDDQTDAESEDDEDTDEDDDASDDDDSDGDDESDEARSDADDDTDGDDDADEDTDADDDAQDEQRESDDDETDADDESQPGDESKRGKSEAPDDDDDTDSDEEKGKSDEDD